MLSVVIPSYNEEENILNTAEVIAGVLVGAKIDYELIFVDDGSKDSTWDKIEKAHEINLKSRGVRLSRNFGKEGAIFAGLEASTGDCCCVIDCDLQHPPQVITKMYELWQNGAEVVEGKKSSRGHENKLYRSLSQMFYGLIQSASKIDMANTSDFKLLDKRVVDAILSLPERITFFRALSGWVGFKSETVYYEVQERAYGSRKWTVKMLLGYAIRNLSSFTGAPLYISTILGIAVILTSLVLMILSLCGVPLGSFNMGIIVLMLIGGGILECLGIGCYYISRIYEEIKHRPRYIVSKTIETDKNTIHNGNGEQCD